MRAFPVTARAAHGAEPSIHPASEVAAVRVIVCHALPVTRIGLCAQLEGQQGITVVESTDSGLHVLSILNERAADVVLTGLVPRGIPALELVRRLGASMPSCPVVVYDVQDDENTVCELLTAGATGLLTDDADATELRAALLAVTDGGAILAPRIARWLVGWFRSRYRPRDDSWEAMLADLTSREREVLVCTALGMSAREIAAYFVIGEATVRTHIYRLRVKLDCEDRAQIVALAYRAGIVGADDRPPNRGRVFAVHENAQRADIARANPSATALEDDRLLRSS